MDTATIDYTTTAMKSYNAALFYKFAMLLLVAGALNWLIIGLTGINVVEKLFGATIGRVIYILVGLAAVFVLFRRDFYLPFLGQTVVPCAGLKNYVPPGATEEVVIKVSPGAKVIYWAAEPAEKKNGVLADWRRAYSGFENAGVTTADDTGRAILRLRAPQPYTVPWKGRLESHVHYRECSATGMMSAVKTTFIGGKKGVEGFTSQMNGGDDSVNGLANYTF